MAGGGGGGNRTSHIWQLELRNDCLQKSMSKVKSCQKSKANQIYHPQANRPSSNRSPTFSTTMSNIPSSDIAPGEIPDGFSLADPTGHAAGAPKQNEAAAQRDAQRQAILEQAMTHDALARLRRVKVRFWLL